MSLIKKLPYKNDLFSYFFNQIYSSYSNVSQKEIQESLAIPKEQAKILYLNLKNLKVLSAKGSLIYSSCKDENLNKISIENSLKEFIKTKNRFALSKVNEEKFEKGLHYGLDFLDQKFINDDSSFGFEKNSGKILLEQYEILFQEGSLRYKDSFSFGIWYLERYPQIKSILQKRFKYIFIDEMQDLEEFQIQIIDKIFFNNGAKTVVQRIGDKNQSIYNSVRENCDWVTREEKEPKKYTDLKIQNSLRLSPIIGKLVDSFVLQRPEKYKVIGIKEIDGGCIPPHLILLNKKTTGEALRSKFENIICQFNLHDCIKNKENGFHIISWRTENENEISDKIYLKKIFPEFSKESKQKKEDFDCLKKHLFLFDREKQTFEAIRKSILNALIRILRIEEIYKDKFINQFYRKSTLIEFYKNQGNDIYDDFNSKLFFWCFEIITKSNYEEVFYNIKEFIQSNNFIGMNWYNEESHVPKTIIKSHDFINRKFDFNLVKIAEKEEDKISEIKIKLSSIHSVKGQTHCATMYIESAYRTPVYETLKFKTKKPYLFEQHSCKGVYDKQALKMMYVGFSRPTHLLCFAVLEENVKEDLDKFKKAGWKVIDDLINVD